MASEPEPQLKRSAEDGVSAASVMLLDIEGTTTSISFVKDELFPYVKDNVKGYLISHFDEPQALEDIDALRKQVDDDKKNGLDDAKEIAASESSKEEIIDTAVENVLWQMELDRKTTALKQLQGHMWRDAYEQGLVKGHLYPEVSKCIKTWFDTGKTVCIYSSGSVAAQKLLFKHSVDGDLTKYLREHFDTKIGGKREASSYVKISECLKIDPSRILFLTDVVQEAEAAQEAGMLVSIMLRPGNAPLSEYDRMRFTTWENFNQIAFEETKEANQKKLKAEEAI